MDIFEPRIAKVILSVVTALAAGCQPGIYARVTMPPASERYHEPPSSMAPNVTGADLQIPGVIVDAGDGTEVCARLKVYAFRGAKPRDMAAMPSDMKPYTTGGSLAKFDPKTRRCDVLVANLPPGNDWWLLVDYPVVSPADSKTQYYLLSKSQAGSHVSGGAFPVAVTDKQTTNVDIELKPSNGPERMVSVPLLHMTGLAK